MKKIFLVFVILFSTSNAQYGLNFYDYIGYYKGVITKEFGLPSRIENLEENNYCYIYKKNNVEKLIKNSIIIFCFNEYNKINIVTISYLLRKNNNKELDNFSKMITKKLRSKNFKLIDIKLNEYTETYSIILYNYSKNIKIDIEVKDVDDYYLSLTLFAYKVD